MACVHLKIISKEAKFGFQRRILKGYVLLFGRGEHIVKPDLIMLQKACLDFIILFCLLFVLLAWHGYCRELMNEVKGV